MKVIRLYLGCFLALASCKTNMPSDKTLDSKLKAKILSGSKQLIMSELTNFSWDSLLILHPYSLPDRIEEDLGIDLSMIKHTGINYGDNTNVIVYLYKGEVVNMVDFDRYPGDFARNGPELIPKTKAIFDVMVTDHKNIDGNNWIDVVWTGK